ncbi:MAG: hypothetical protein NTX25_15995, partial [Proteobacteria bacterium]|nr:hypothetical protein [Pseudomonadota bacterium]
MEPIPPCLAELESSARANLHAYLRRELASEYQAKHRNKASKIPAASLRELRISGEQLQAYVDESLHSYRVDMSFPFFDLEADFTLIKCSCMREALSFEPQRCHHMYRVQDYVANLLDRLSQMEVQDGPLASLLELVSSPSQDTDHETWLLETRWILLWDAASSELSLEHATRSLYGKAATWQVQGRWPSKDALPILQNLGDPVARKLCETLRRAAQSADSEIFELLGLARDDATVLIEEKGSRVSLRVENSTWQIFVSEEAEGYRLHIKLSTAQLSPTNVIKGQGLVAFDSEAQIIYLARLESPYAALVEGIMGQSRLIPKGDREAMLAFIEKLDPGIAVLWAESPIQATPVERMQTLLRLTPFQRGGMKLEIWLQLSPGTLVRAAQGLERIRERSYRGQLREFIRDFTLEQKLQRRVEHRLDLELLPEPEPGIFIAYNDELALGLMSRIELAKSELELLLEWPKAMLDKTQAYQVSSVIDGQSLRVSVTEKRDWFALEGWLEMDDGQKISLRELLLACRQDKRYVRLADGKWAVISDHFRQRLDPLVKNFEEDDGDCLLDLAVLGSNAEQAALEKFDFSSASQGFWRLVQQTKHARKIDAQLPTGLLAELRPYQLDGFKWLYHL